MLSAALVALAAAGKPVDGSDLLSLEEARAEVVRLRAKLAATEPTGAGQWVEVPTAHSPPYRSSGGMATLTGGPLQGGVLLFGGADGEHSGSFLNDTWLLFNNDWIELKPPVVPGTRSNPQIIPYKSGAVMFGGFGPDTSRYGITTLGDTWLFEATGSNPPTGTWRELTLPTSPAARAYHTFTPYFGGGLLFGGRTAIWTNRVTALGDTWVFDEDKWRQLESTIVPTTVLQSTSMPAPSARMGQIVVCGLNATVEPEIALNPSLNPPGNEEFVGPADCVLYGGAVVADADFFSDTWLLYRNNGTPVWKQQNNYGTAPRGRWCFAATACTDPSHGIVMAGGSIDYRVSGVGTYHWTATPVPHEPSSENPGHPPGYTGKWELVDTSTGASLQSAGTMMTTTPNGVLLWGGYFNASGGNHPGKLNENLWRWTGC